MSYFKRDFAPTASKQFAELPPRVFDAQKTAARAALVAQGSPALSALSCAPTVLAVAATGEYAQFHGGSRC
ncbi:MAG: hypothetical protein R3E79_04230 [Caldilineaceae bacterium]